VTVQYQNIQKSPTYSSGYALRFPRITRLREDRGVSDIATVGEVEREAGE
jgi:DNA ligase-1